MILSPYQKPPLGSKLNYGHPLSKELLGCWLMNEKSGDRVNDATSGQQGIITGATWSPFGIQTINTNDSLNCGLDSRYRFTTGNFSFLIKLIVLPGTGHYLHPAGKGAYNIAGYIWDLGYIDSGYHAIKFFAFDTASHNISSASIFKLSVENEFVFVREGAKGKLYGNGRFITENNNFGGSISYSSEYNLLFGKGDTNAIVGNYIHSFIWGRALTAQEVAYLYARPYCMFDKPTLPAWMYSTGGVAPIMHHYKQLRSY
jgi:hypothetical protein